jgi:hypothetical protein
MQDIEIDPEAMLEPVFDCVVDHLDTTGVEDDPGGITMFEPDFEGHQMRFHGPPLMLVGRERTRHLRTHSYHTHSLLSNVGGDKDRIFVQVWAASVPTAV